jgi:predicted metalloprotease
VRWRGERESDQVEDRRGHAVPRGGIAIGGGGLLLLVVLSLVTGQNPLDLLEVVSGPPRSSVEPGPTVPRGVPGDEEGRFASVVLASTEDVWEQQLAQRGTAYRRPTLVLFSDAVESACGLESSAVGPFYCPRDGKVYLDLSFFADLTDRFGAPGDFARAYVIAHEVGHHVQNLLGISDAAADARRRGSAEDANAVSVRLELQADCLAGVWGHGAGRDANLLEPGDVEEGLAAAAAIGDDRLQKRAQGYTVPETWTHGSSEMRVRWLRRGLESGDLEACDTFRR